MIDRNGVHVFMACAQYRKPWAWIETTRGAAPFSFADQYAMIRYVGQCEVIKYGMQRGFDPSTREAWDRWTFMPRSFLDACWEYDATYPQLAKQFGLR